VVLDGLRDDPAHRYAGRYRSNRILPGAHPFTVSRLSSTRSDKSLEERKQSEEGEGLLVLQKIGEKVHDGRRPIKFPEPRPNTFGAIVVDMRGHFGGGDIEDWKQIAFWAEVVPPELRKYWLDKNDVFRRAILTP
jgi:hypothetical protein